MSYRIEDFENDPSWISSVGEKLGKIHFRKGRFHAECDPKTGFCSIHEDNHDPHESVDSLLKHLSESKSGKVILGVVVVGILDQILTGGIIRKSVTRSLL